MKKFLTYVYLLLASNMRSHISDKKKFASMAAAMFLQNGLFFLLWVILFDKVSNLKGWSLVEYSHMYSIICIAYGVCNVLFAGVRFLPQYILDGSFDSYISKPRHPLLSLMCSYSAPAALGDILFGVMLLSFFGRVSFYELPFFCLMVFAAISVLIASTVILYSTSLWLKGNARFPDQLYEVLLIFSANMIHGQSFFVKAIAFTVIPAAFINYLPTKLLHNFNWTDMAILLAGAAFYLVAALTFFNGGVRRYKRMS